MPDSILWLRPDLRRWPDRQHPAVSCFTPKQQGAGGMVWFLRELVLEELPARAVAHFTGDCKFRLFVNGCFVDDGPVEVGGDYGNTEAPGWWFLSERDLTGFLKPGVNEFRAEVLLEPEAQTDYSTGNGGFRLELCDGNGRRLFETDRMWRAIPNPAWSLAGYDARREPGEPASWPHADAVPDSRRLLRLDLPPLREKTVGPAAVRVIYDGEGRFFEPGAGRCLPGAPVSLLFEFPREVAAHLEFEVSGAAGAKLEFEFQELPGVTHHRFGYTLREGCQRYRLTRLNAFQWVRLTVHCGAFGMVKAAPVELHGLWAKTRGFPVECRGEFHASDPRLEKLWNCCRNTLELCMQRLELDSPVHQEGLGCTGDYRIGSLMSYLLFGETRLAAADLRRTALLLFQKEGRMFHTSYTLAFIEMLRDYCYYSTDRELVRELFPAVRLVLKRFATYVGPELLVSEAPDYLFIDWINDGRFDWHHPPASRGTGAMTAFYFRALRSAAELAELAGEEDAPELLRRAEAVRGAFRERLWDRKRRCFADGLPFLTRRAPGCWFPADTKEMSFSAHTNALAVAYGLVPEAERGRLAARLCDPANGWPRPQPFFCHYLFDALDAAGRFGSDGFRLLEKWHALVAEHPSSLKECWECGDYCHAWGGTPVIQMMSRILGVTPAEPFYGAVRIAPQPGPLAWASGSVPTPHGPVEVNWSCSGDGFRMTATVPEGLPFQVVPPLPGSRITVNGRTC